MEFRELEGKRIGEVSWIQEEIRDRVVPGQEGSPRLAKHQDGERRVQSQENLEASRKASDRSGWRGLQESCGAQWRQTAPFLSPSSLPVLLLSPPLFAWNKGLLLLPGCPRYLLSSALFSASTPHQQKCPFPPSHVPTAHSWSFPKLLKKWEKRPVPGASLDLVSTVERDD